MRAAGIGWAQMYLKRNPYSGYRRTSCSNYEQEALRQGYIAVNSILRDWIKGQVTANRERHPVVRSRVHAPHVDG
jgi:hypothetical protein